MPIHRPSSLKDVGAHKVIGLKPELVPLFLALPDLGDVISRAALTLQYMLPLESLEVPYTLGGSMYDKGAKVFALFARPAWRSVPNSGDLVTITAHLVFFWKNRDKPWDAQPSVRLTSTIAQLRESYIESMLYKGC